MSWWDHHRPPADGKVGYWTSADPGAASTRILFNGDDVSARCSEANDRKGYVKVYKLNESGLFVIENSRFVQEKLIGKVEIKLFDRMPIDRPIYSHVSCATCGAKDLETFYSSKRSLDKLCQKCFDLVPGGKEVAE